MQPNGIDPSDDAARAPLPISEMMTREAMAIMDGKAPPLVNPIMTPGTSYPSDTMLVQDVPGGAIAAVAPAYKTVELRFGDAAITLRGDGGLDGDLAAFTAALATINPAADDVAYAVGWLVARVCHQERVDEEMNGRLARLGRLMIMHGDCHALAIGKRLGIPIEAFPDPELNLARIPDATDPDPGDADPSEPAEEMFPEGKAYCAKLAPVSCQLWDDFAPEVKAQWQADAERNAKWDADHLSERATHEAAQARVTRDYNA